MVEAGFYHRGRGGTVVCDLCPRGCVVAPGDAGFCGVRRNEAGTLYSLVYGRPAAMQIDPVEKKPFREYLPGTKTFSIGTFGCNLDCACCQNDEISGCRRPDVMAAVPMREPDEIVRLARHYRCASVAFTYNEPTVFAEYAIAVATVARREGLATLLVSNAYISPKAAEALFPLIDAANFDLKGFSEEFYREHCRGRLAPVLEAIRYFHRLGRHLEVTNLVIPTRNDSPEMIRALLDWVGEQLSPEVPLHFTAFFPHLRLAGLPRTPRSTLEKIRDLALARGFRHVYLGNC